MWDIVLKGFAILGITLLSLIGLVLLLLLILLFFPITYKGNGFKNSQETNFRFKAIWLFGLVRGSFYYPTPGVFQLKLLMFTILPGSKDKVKSDQSAISSSAPQGSAIPSETQDPNKVDDNSPDQNTDPSKETASESSEAISPAKEEENYTSTDRCAEDKKGFFAKIKYTIHSIYDKIRKVIDNISFYIHLLQDKNTIELLSHMKKRLIKILKAIRPRHLYADVLFGTGQPDTTGYVLAVYSMFSYLLGKNVTITPDFEEKILEGKLKFSGHITLFVILWHCLIVLADKKLRIFMHSYKTGRK